MVDRAHNVTRHANDAAATPVPAHWSLWLLAPLLAAAFFAAEHDVRLAGRQVGGVEETTIVDSYLNDAEGGNRLRQVGFLSFAAMGGLMLVAGRARGWSINSPIAPLVVATLLWALATAIW